MAARADCLSERVTTASKSSTYVRTYLRMNGLYYIVSMKRPPFDCCITPASKLNRKFSARSVKSFHAPWKSCSTPHTLPVCALQRWKIDWCTHPSCLFPPQNDRSCVAVLKQSKTSAMQKFSPSQVPLIKIVFK